ncbi:hypothetical protein [Paenibacillus sp. FJAT-27812]|uniref:hypothetical protein n=1 Tax=Paenibacillus sp. FJAT-27812 TaxID=1684143 RepID=UPI0006A77AA9|nr:hypothetical protein [Paenibacillus sp. FJAT-27812]
MKRILLSLLVLLFLCSCQKQFSAEVWKDEPEQRNSMVDHLINRGELKDKTESEIISLLGEPEQKIEEPNHEFVYYLGRAGLGVDDSLLKLKFGKDGKLESHLITHD